MKVFLVEDSAPVLERLRALLAAVPGASVVGHAAGAPEAIAGILAAKPDVVMLDLKLAPGSGFDVLSAVHPHEPAIDFYMLSNFSAEAYRKHALRLGAKYFFDKTTDFERVRNVVAQRAAATQ